jgi:hypothetical protein
MLVVEHRGSRRWSWTVRKVEALDLGKIQRVTSYFVKGLRKYKFLNTSYYLVLAFVLFLEDRLK